LQEVVKQGAPSGNSNAAKNKDGNNSIFVSPSVPARDLAATKVGVSKKVIDLARQVADKAPNLAGEAPDVQEAVCSVRVNDNPKSTAKQGISGYFAGLVRVNPTKLNKK